MRAIDLIWPLGLVFPGITGLSNGLFGTTLQRLGEFDPLQQLAPGDHADHTACFEHGDLVEAVRAELVQHFERGRLSLHGEHAVARGHGALGGRVRPGLARACL